MSSHNMNSGILWPTHVCSIFDAQVLHVILQQNALLMSEWICLVCISLLCMTAKRASEAGKIHAILQQKTLQLNIQLPSGSGAVQSPAECWIRLVEVWHFSRRWTRYSYVNVCTASCFCLMSWLRDFGQPSESLKTAANFNSLKPSGLWSWPNLNSSAQPLLWAVAVPFSRASTAWTPSLLKALL